MNRCIHCEYSKERNQVLIMFGTRGTSVQEIKDISPNCFGCKYLFESDHFNKALKKCPFCGGKGQVISDAGGDTGEVTYTIECEKCACDIGWYPSKQEAIEAWNRRA